MSVDPLHPELSSVEELREWLQANPIRGSDSPAGLYPLAVVFHSLAVRTAHQLIGVSEYLGQLRDIVAATERFNADRR